MTHLPNPVYPEDVDANPQWFGDINTYYYECDDWQDSCPQQKHYHPKAHRVIAEMFKKG